MVGVTKIIINETAEELKELMNQQRKAKHRERLQALYLLKSGKTEQIVEIAEVIGRSRSTIHRWLHLYQKYGLKRLMSTGKKPGRKAHVPEWAVNKLKQHLQDSKGFNSYVEIQQWLDSECGIKVNYHVVHELARHRLRVKRKNSRLVYSN